MAAVGQVRETSPAIETLAAKRMPSGREGTRSTPGAGFGNRSTPHAAGNQAIQRLLSSPVQPSVEVNAPGDAAERVAEDQMTASPPRMVQRKCAACSAGATCSECEEEQTIQKQEQPGPSPKTSTHVATQIASLRGGGQPLSAGSRSFFEPLFGRDFSEVRVHTGRQAANSARAISARAYTTGQDVVFAQGNYTPGTAAGDKLLAHELTHVVQQREGLQLDGGMGQAGDSYERQADDVADAVGRGSADSFAIARSQNSKIQRSRVIQRDGDEDPTPETKDQFAERVRQRAASRLTENVGVLGQWSDYVRNMEVFQLRAQLMTGNLTEYALVASRTPGGRARFERAVGTEDPAQRRFDESMLDITSNYRERSNLFIGSLESNAFGHWTDPSTAQKMRVVAGEIHADDLEPSRWVPGDIRYSEYVEPLRRFRSGESGGCQTCHDINRAWGLTAERWGSPLPEGQLGGELFTGPTNRLSGLGPPLGNVNITTQQREALIAFVNANTSTTTSTTTPLTTPPVQPVVQQPAVVQGPGVVQPPLLAPQEPDIVSQPFIVGQPGTGAAEGPQSPWVPDIPLPEGVKIPPPRTDLCGSLPEAEDSARTPARDSWGPNSAIVARIIRNIDAVLTPLGPRGYRVLGRNSIDSLYSMTPDNIESVRNRIIFQISERSRGYEELRASILRGGVPYEELCPIVDELLPTTNEWVQYQALEDVHDWQRRETLLTILELTLLALTVMFPPAAALTIPAGMLLGLARISLGLDQQRQGRQWVQGTGSGIYSLEQEAQAPTLAERGRSNIIGGSISFGLSALGLAGMISQARNAARIAQALENGAIITHPDFPGVAILARGGRLLMVTESGQALGYGVIRNGQVVWTRFATPYYPFGGSYGPGVGGTSIVPYGPTSIVPYGGQLGPTSIVPFGGAGPLGEGTALAPLGQTGLAAPTFGTGLLPYGQGRGPLLPQGPIPLQLPSGPIPLQLTAGNVVDPGGRGVYRLAESQISRLSATDAARLRELQSRMPASQAELEELTALRARAVGGELPETAGTPEHMLTRWRQYVASGRDMTFQQWAAGHPSRMANSVGGIAREESYRIALAEVGVPSRGAVLQTPSGQRRQIDVLIEGGRGQGRVIIQIKAGKASLSTTPRQSGGASLGSSSLSNTEALAADAEFIATGDHVVWVHEELPTGPLVARARELHVDVIIRVDNAAGRTRMVGLMHRARMSQAEIDAVIFVEGTDADVVNFVAQRYRR
jgi:hypothetical protein